MNTVINKVCEQYWSANLDQLNIKIGLAKTRCRSLIICMASRKQKRNNNAFVLRTKALMEL